jgi:glutathione S-transferase
MPLEYVDLAAARGARGSRLVTSALVPSPWSEAAKGLFDLTRLPVLVVARGRDTTEISAWTGVDNVPVVLHDDEPARTSWAAIVGLIARLAPGVVLPEDPIARADVMGWLDLVAGEGGLGWTARLAMIDTSLTTGRGFPVPVAERLAKRYGYRPEHAGGLRDRAGSRLAALAGRLRGDYFGGATPNALDIYVATFLTPLTVLDDATCPQMIEPLRVAFGTARERLADLVPAALWTHRARMFERHLTLPIRLA